MVSLPYIQTIDTCFDAAIGAGGVSRAAFEPLLAKAETALDWLRDAHDKNSLPLLRVPARNDDLAALREVSAKLLDKTTDLFVLGTGGSSLGAQAFAQLTGWGTQGFRREGPSIHFLDNLDPVTFDAVLANCDLRSTRFLIVSKSGSTIETTMQTLAAMSAIEKAGGGKYMKYHFAVLTEPTKNGVPNSLRALAERSSFPTLEHDPGVGGRYAALTNVGLLPAQLFGLDIEAIRAGAHEALAPVLSGASAGDVAPAVGAALSVALAKSKGASISVFMAYADRLERFLAWHCQLWAESLGKAGEGTTPVKALGPVDQHSQLQLYLAGPADKMFTIFTTDVKGKGPEVSEAVISDAVFASLGGRSIGDLVDAEQRATIDTLVRNGRPVRHIHAAKLDERSMGALMMHFMLETIIAGHILGIDPFDQPAVEEGKILAKTYLAGGA